MMCIHVLISLATISYVILLRELMIWYHHFFQSLTISVLFFEGVLISYHRGSSSSASKFELHGLFLFAIHHAYSLYIIEQLINFLHGHGTNYMSCNIYSPYFILGSNALALPIQLMPFQLSWGIKENLG